MIDLAAIRSESRRYIATEGRVPVLELIEGLDGHEQLQALDALLGGDDKLRVGIGGNPIYVDAFLAKARDVLAKARGESSRS
jgi:hypothetical protein